MKPGILRTKFHFLKFDTNAVRHKGKKESKTIPLLTHIWITFKVTDKDKF